MPNDYRFEVVRPSGARLLATNDAIAAVTMASFFGTPVQVVLWNEGVPFVFWNESAVLEGALVPRETIMDLVECAESGAHDGVHQALLARVAAQQPR